MRFVEFIIRVVDRTEREKERKKTVQTRCQNIFFQNAYVDLDGLAASSA